MRVATRYERALWWTMDAMGISESIGAKLLVAVALQLAVSIGQAAISVLAAGWFRVELSVALFALALLAFENTVLIVKRDLIEPITGLERASTAVARGDLDVDVPSSNRPDEVGRLVVAFQEMVENLRLVADQAEAPADQSFDDPVLDDQVPGRFGRILSEMTESLTEYIETVERDRDRFRLLNYLVGHDVPNVLTVLYGRLELLEADCDDPDLAADIELLRRKVREIEEITSSVNKLTSNKLLLAVDVGDIVAEAAAETRATYPDGTVTVSVPDADATVRANDLLVRAFVNPFTNAIEHNPDADPHVDVAVTVEGDAVRVRIADDGPGLGVDDVQGFFDDLDPGTGLHIAGTIVERFGGELTVLETGPDGTAFAVALPLSDD
ncbi:MAG: ATP-binding protein [Halanaeroarchaeum sp.]